MDAKSINFSARQSLGFFIAGKADSDKGRSDFELFEKVTKFTTELLRQEKLRPANVNSHMPELSDVILKIQDYAIEIGVDAPSSLGYSTSILFASLSRYATLMDRKRSK